MVHHDATPTKKDWEHLSVALSALSAATGGAAIYTEAMSMGVGSPVAAGLGAVSMVFGAISTGLDCMTGTTWACVMGLAATSLGVVGISLRTALKSAEMTGVVSGFLGLDIIANQSTIVISVAGVGTIAWSDG